MKQGRILVVRGGAIGDFILTLPVLSALRRQFPGTRLEVLGYPHIARLAAAGGLADHVTSIESRALAGFFARGGELDPALAAYVGSFDLIVSFLYDPDGIFRDNVSRAGRAQFVAGAHRPSETAGLHATAVFLQTLERLAIFDADPVPALPCDGADWRTAAGGGRWLAVHPGSGAEAKNWPLERWHTLMGELVRDCGIRLLVVGGEVERETLPRLIEGLPAGCYRVMMVEPLEQVARTLRWCDAFLGHDSGITHLAAAVGVRTLALWGPSRAEVWRPLGAHVRLLQDSGGLAALRVERVREELGKVLSGGLPTTAD